MSVPGVAATATRGWAGHAVSDDGIIDLDMQPSIDDDRR